MRISVTELDQFRLYLEGELTFEQLKIRLSPHEFTEETPAMQNGSSFHDFLEHATPGTVEKFEDGGMEFVLDCDTELYLPCIRELKTEHQFTVDGIEVTLVGKVDAVEGQTVWDHKLTQHWDPERYTDAVQWRAYLLLFGANRFVYNVFESNQGPLGCEVKSLHQISLHSYRDMKEDVMGYLTGLVRLLRDHIPERLTFGDEKNTPRVLTSSDTM